MGFEQIPNIDKRRGELDKEHAKLENKGYTTPDDIEKKKKIEEEHQELSGQVKEIEKEKDIKENDEKRRELDEKHEKLSNKDFKTPEDTKEIEKIEKEHEQLSKHSKIIDKKGREKEEERKKEKLNDWELHDKWNEVCKSLEKDKNKDKIINDCLNKDIEELHQYLEDNKFILSKEAEEWVKINIDVKEKEKSLLDEWGTNKDKKEEKEEKVEVKEEVQKESKTEEVKDEMKEEPKEKIRKNSKKDKKEKDKGKEDLEKTGVLSTVEKIFQDPEALSKIFHEAFEVSKNPKVQRKFQELKDVIKKIVEEEKETPDSVKNAKEFIKKEVEKKEKNGKEKKESPWETISGAMGWSILLFLVLFMLAELKGIDYLSGQAAGKKK